jgi:hypothetical protein
LVLMIHQNIVLFSIEILNPSSVILAPITQQTLGSEYLSPEHHLHLVCRQ